MTQLIQNLHSSPYIALRPFPASKNVVLRRTALYSSYPPRRPPAFTSSVSSAKCTVAPSVRSKTPSHSSSLLGQDNGDAKERIRKLFHGVDVSASPYDTAWVAMVPDSRSSGPLFPECIDWVVSNQLEDGSWRLTHHTPNLMKDVLSSTLACVLALKKWGYADDQVLKGVGFIELNFAIVSDEEHLVSPLGFDIIFPSMLQYARGLDLNLQLDTKTLSDMLHKRDFAIKSFSESNSKDSREYLAYISEGMLASQDWDMAMKFQRKNGSLLNSPSATAAAAIHLQNPDCINYLQLVVEKFGPSVPAVYPLEIYLRLSLVDNLERLGISRHFKEEIQNVLNDTYRYWQQENEEIFAEASTCALAFQLLRNHGYDISSDPLTKFIPEDDFGSSLCGYWRNTNTMLELHRASELIIDQNETALEKLFFLSKNLLIDKISGGGDFTRFNNNQLHNEVENILKLPSHAKPERVANKTFIEQYELDNTRILKTSYCSLNFSNKDLLSLSIHDFNYSQALHREEIKHIQSWFLESRFGEMEFAWDVSGYAYFSAATTICSPELSDARLLFAKNGVLVTVIDDFFDSWGSIEELKDLIELVEKWDVKLCNTNQHCSESVRIIFSAIYSVVTEVSNKAFKWQERDVTSHLIEIWLRLLYNELKEAEWNRKSSPPDTVDEYMETSHISFGYEPIILSTAYLVGPKLSDEVATSPEMHSLHKLVGTCGRLLNDLQGFESERELKDGKSTYVPVRLRQAQGCDRGITLEEVIAEMKSLIKKNRRELLRLVLQENRSVVPRACKDLFWDASQIVHMFYHAEDQYRTLEMHKLVKSIIHEPIKKSTS